MSKPELNDEYDWQNYLTKKLDLDAYESEMLLHDINNLRGDEWLDAIIDAGVPADIIAQYKEFAHIHDDDEEDG